VTAAEVEIGAVTPRSCGFDDAGMVRTDVAGSAVLIVSTLVQARSAPALHMVGAGHRSWTGTAALSVARARRLQRRLVGANCHLASGSARVLLTVAATARPRGAASGRALIAALAAVAPTAIATADLASAVGLTKAAPSVTELIRAARAATPPAAVRAARLPVALGLADTTPTLTRLVGGAPATRAPAAV
jgi:hypothetical protein